jgi:hypothetical protein
LPRLQQWQWYRWPSYGRCDGQQQRREQHSNTGTYGERYALTESNWDGDTGCYSESNAGGSNNRAE